MKELIKLIKKNNNEQGMALVTVLMVFVVVSILGVSLIGLAANNLKMSTGERNNQSAYYIAESGVTYMMNEFNQKIKEAFNEANNSETQFYSLLDSKLNLPQVKTYNDFEQSQGHQPVANITISKSPTQPKQYTVASIGTIDNRSRTVSKSFIVNWKHKPPINKAIYVRETIDIVNMTVYGSVGTSLTQQNAISFLGNKGEIVGGDKIYGAKDSLIMPTFPTFSITTTDNYSNTLLSMNEDKQYDKITVPTNLEINTGTQDRVLTVNTLELSNHAKISITGTGKLTINAKNIIMGTQSVINTGKDINKLKVYLEGAGTTLGSGVIYGSIFAKVANIPIGVDTGVQGHVITFGTSVTITGSNAQFTPTPKLVLAPNATVSLNTDFSGAIIAKSFTANGNDDTIRFIQQNIEDLPFEIKPGPIQEGYVEIDGETPVSEN